MNALIHYHQTAHAPYRSLERAKEWRRENPDADVNTNTTDDGYTWIHMASKEGHLDVVRYFVESCNGDPTVPSDDGTTALHCACIHGYLNVAKYLVEVCGVDIDKQAKSGNTALHSACRHGRLAVVNYLVESCKSDPNAANTDGDTPLHRACRFGNSNVAKYLLTSRKANIAVRNNSNQIPLDYAKVYQRTDILAFWASHCMDLLSEQMEDTQQQTADEASDEAPATTSDDRSGLSTKIDIGQDRLNAIHTGALADVIFLCGEGDKQEAVKANSAVLLVTVPSIKALIASGIKNQPSPSRSPGETVVSTTVPLTSLHPRHVRYVLKCIYSGDVSFEDGSSMTAKDNLEQLVLVANQFGFWRLKLIIEAELVHKHLTNATMIDLLLFAHRNNCLLLKEAAVAMASKDGNVLFDHPHSGKLIPETALMGEIFAKRHVNPAVIGATDEYSSMSMMEMYKALDEVTFTTMESYLDRASLLEFMRTH
uniref:BTB domain-containing protein n=1 Tax=Craspedostauros australis TaxID=1486917 RepID=A0A7R9WS08_9STRA|mmetsp:Transcript_172/g.437  ORF Transcript_172/g.437 Transcript_172/m.437 type:complete len:482 (+) Transcript_172:86-1531(+)